MEKFIVDYWKTLAFFALVGLVGGFFTGLYVLDSYPEEMRQQIYDQGLNDVAVGAVTAVQSALYGLVLGAGGIFFARKTGLWKDERTITKKPLTAAVIVAIFGGLAIFLPDVLFFGKHAEVIMDLYAAKPTVSFMIASVLYGGVLEEVMLRLFVMSLIAFLLHRLFNRKSEKPAAVVLIAANVIAALLFSAGHLPTTFIMLGSSPVILLRCFLLNGGVGLLLGRLYRKTGLRYAMIAHGGCPVVSKLIWILFI